MSWFCAGLVATAHGKCPTLNRRWSTTSRFEITRKVAGFRTFSGFACSETRWLILSCVALITLPGSESRYRILVFAMWASTVLIYTDSPVLLRRRLTSLVQSLRCQSSATAGWLIMLRDSVNLLTFLLSLPLQGTSSLWLKRWGKTHPAFSLWH